MAAAKGGPTIVATQVGFQCGHYQLNPSDQLQHLFSSMGLAHGNIELLVIWSPTRLQPSCVEGESQSRYREGGYIHPSTRILSLPLHPSRNACEKKVHQTLPAQTSSHFPVFVFLPFKVVSDYLTSFDGEEAFLKANGAPVAVYTYKVAFLPAAAKAAPPAAAVASAAGNSTAPQGSSSIANVGGGSGGVSDLAMSKSDSLLELWDAAVDVSAAAYAP